MTPTRTIDAIGLLCPLPVLRLRKALQTLASGETLCLLADDPVAQIDILHFCVEQGETLLSSTPQEGATAFLIRKT